MKKLIFSALLAALLISCATDKPVNDLLTSSNLDKQFFTISPESDTLLRTSHGSTLRIKKGTFKTSGKLTIEIREAFTPAEIFLAGMTTTSNGKPLRSAGMIYLNASSDGNAIEPLLPISTFIPAENPDTSMQLFKGEIQPDSSVNWVDSEPLDTIKTNQKLFELGKALFLSKCHSCHSPFKDGTGPVLRGVQNRGPWRNTSNLVNWIKNPVKFMSKDKYTKDLKRKFGSMMQAYPDVSEREIQGILSYINTVSEKDYQHDNDSVWNESEKKHPVDTAATRDFHMSDCGEDTTYISIENSFPEYDTTTVAEIMSDTNSFENYAADIIDTSYSDTVTTEYDYIDDSYKQGYEFNITSNGWYNVDAFLKTDLLKGEVKDVKLVVDLIMDQDISMNVYVFVPTERILQSTNDRQKNKYFFNFNDGTIPLPLRYRAVIFAYGSFKDKIYYGVSEFTIKSDQRIPVEIKETTKDKLQYILQSKNINGVELNAIEKEMRIDKKICDDLPVADSIKK